MKRNTMSLMRLALLVLFTWLAGCSKAEREAPCSTDGSGPACGEHLVCFQDMPMPRCMQPAEAHAYCSREAGCPKGATCLYDAANGKCMLPVSTPARTSAKTGP